MTEVLDRACSICRVLRASHWLIDPEGRRNPGGWVCRRCGGRVVEEYRVKLDESWRLQPLRRIVDGVLVGASES